jgi:hypothetical protein
MTLGAKKIPLEIRYERHIDRSAGPDGCWVWTGSGNQAGYGQLRVGRKGPVISVHRWAYEHFVGPIPEGYWVCHHCDNPKCSNPKHLYAGTPQENMRDAVVRGRRPKKVKFGGRVKKLTDDMVRAIRADTRPACLVAVNFGVSECTVFAIRARRRKDHVPNDGPTFTPPWPMFNREVTPDRVLYGKRKVRRCRAPVEG